MSTLTLIDKLTLQLNQDWLRLNQVKGFEFKPDEVLDSYYFPRYRREAWLKIFYTINDAGLNTDFTSDLRSSFEKGELA